jgi:hypothetical protein
MGWVVTFTPGEVPPVAMAPAVGGFLTDEENRLTLPAFEPPFVTEPLYWLSYPSPLTCLWNNLQALLFTYIDQRNYGFSKLPRVNRPAQQCWNWLHLWLVFGRNWVRNPAGTQTIGSEASGVFCWSSHLNSGSYNAGGHNRYLPCPLQFTVHHNS